MCNTSTYVNLPARYEKTQGQQSSIEIHRYSVIVPHTSLPLQPRMSCSDTVVSQQMPYGRSPDGVAKREMATSNQLMSSYSTQSGAEVHQQMLSGRCADGVPNREMAASNLLVSSNSTQFGAEVPQQMLSGRCPDRVTNREMAASNLPATMLYINFCANFDGSVVLTL